MEGFTVWISRLFNELLNLIGLIRNFVRGLGLAIVHNGAFQLTDCITTDLKARFTTVSSWVRSSNIFFSSNYTRVNAKDQFFLLSLEYFAMVFGYEIVRLTLLMKLLLWTKYILSCVWGKRIKFKRFECNFPTSFGIHLKRQVPFYIIWNEYFFLSKQNPVRLLKRIHLVCLTFLSSSLSS